MPEMILDSLKDLRRLQHLRHARQFSFRIVNIKMLSTDFSVSLFVRLNNCSEPSRSSLEYGI